MTIDLKALMKSLNIGPSSEEDHGHAHTADEHTDHDDGVQRWRKRSSDSVEGRESNNTWEQVPT